MNVTDKKRIALAISKELKIRPERLTDAIYAALAKLNSPNAHVCRVCGEPITYQREYEYYLKYYKNNPQNCRRVDYTGERSVWFTISEKEAAKRSAKSGITMRRTCSRCQVLAYDLEVGSISTQQFFEALSALSMIKWRRRIH